jgi:molybdate transport system permease protein
MIEIDPAVSIGLTLAVGVLAVVVSLPLAIALGWLLARRSFPGKSLVSALVLLPMVLPPVVTGLLLLELLGRRGPLGRALAPLGIEIPFGFAAAVIAATVVGLPLFVMAVRAAFEAVDPGLEEVSRALGDEPRRTFVRVTLPLAAPGLAGGAVLAFARALGEFGATIVLAGNTEGTRTIAIAVYSLLDRPGGESRIWPLVAASFALSIVALFGYEMLVRWQRRRLEVDRG